MQSITKPFYSNCLIEALKHKFKNKDVVITYISPRYKGGLTPHFLWSDGVNDYDFGVDYKLKWYNVPVFKGTIRQRPLGWNEMYKENLIKKYERNKSKI